MWHPGGMRIAVVSDAYAPRLGGIEAQVADLAARLGAAGHHVEVLTITPEGSDGPTSVPAVDARNLLSSPATPEEILAGEPAAAAEHAPGGAAATTPVVHRFPAAVPLPSDLLVNPAARGPVRELLRRGRFGVVHAHVGVLSPFAFDTVAIAGDLGIPVVVTWHSLLPRRARVTFRVTRLFDRWHDRGARFTAVSRVTAQRVRAATRTGAEVAVLANGLDLARWTAVHRGGTAPQRRELRLVSAMRLAPIKRPLALLELVAQARRAAPGTRITLELIGEGPLRPQIEAWLRRHGAAGWVRLSGRLPREQLAARYAEAHLYVSPVRDEAFGIAPLEAMCTGLPVVGLAGSGVSEYVEHGVNGLLVPDDAAMSAQIARLALGPEALAALRPPQHDPRLRRFAWPEVIAATQRAYAKALEA